MPSLDELAYDPEISRCAGARSRDSVMQPGAPGNRAVQLQDPPPRASKPAAKRKEERLIYRISIITECLKGSRSSPRLRLEAACLGCKRSRSAIARLEAVPSSKMPHAA